MLSVVVLGFVHNVKLFITFNDLVNLGEVLGTGRIDSLRLLDIGQILKHFVR